MTDHLLIGILIGMTSGIAALIVISAVTLRRFDVAWRQEHARIERGLAELERSWERTTDTLRRDLALAHEELATATREARDESASGARALRDQINGGLAGLATALTARVTELTEPVIGALRAHPMSTLGVMAEAQERQLSAVTSELRGFADAVQARLEEVRVLLAERLGQIQAENQDSLEQMRADVTGHAKDLRNDLLESIDARAEQVRAMVDARIAETLEHGLDAHFGQVGDRLEMVRERLEQVQQGLIEVQSFAAGVGNIQRALATVRLGGSKSRPEGAGEAAASGQTRRRSPRRRSKPALAEAAREAVEAQAP